MPFTLADLKWGSGKQNMGGLLSKAFYCPIDDLDLALLPDLSAVGKLDVTEPIVCKVGKNFVEVYSTPMKNKLDDSTVGEIDGKSKENLYEFFFPGDEEAIAEFERFALNTPCAWVVPDTRGRNRLLGLVNLDPETTSLSADIQAYLEGSNGTSGAARADLKGKTFQFKHSAPHAPLFYKGIVPLTPTIMQDQSGTPIELSEEVAKLYKAAPGVTQEFYHPSVARVNLNRISLRQAERLAAAGVLIALKAEKEKPTEQKK